MNTLDFLKNLKEDSECVEKMKNSKSAEEVYAVLKSEGVTDSYEEVMESLNKIREETLKMSDRIVVIDSGKIVEEGTYDELIAKNVFFASLVERQRVDIN